MYRLAGSVISHVFYLKSVGFNAVDSLNPILQIYNSFLFNSFLVLNSIFSQFFDIQEYSNGS